MSSAHRVGLYYDGSSFSYWVDGSSAGSVAQGISVLGAGISTFASSGSPGAEYDYVWIGSEPIDFNPEDLTSSATSSVGSEAAF